MRKVFLIAFAGLAFAACGKNERPEPIKVMVPVPCVTNKPVKPNFPEARPEAGLFERVQTLLAERELRIAYEGEMEASLSACD